MTNPTIAAVLDRVIADKERHAAFGWLYVTSRAPQWTAQYRALVAEELTANIRETELKGYHCPWLAPEHAAAEAQADVLTASAGPRRRATRGGRRHHGPLHGECTTQARGARRYLADVRIQPHADLLTAMVTSILQLLVAGIGTGSIYALIALGFNVVFKSTGAMNFAQGEWVVMGGMISALLYAAFSNIGLACLVTVLIVTIVGILSERLVIWPLRKPTALLITLLSIGLAICTRSVVMLVLGKRPVGYPGFSQTATLTWGGVTVQTQTLWIVGLTAAFLLVTHLFFERSMLGKALRAAAADREAAAIVGVRVETTVLLSFSIAAFAGALAGAIITPLTLASYDQGAMFGFKGFSAAMLGGVGSLPGAVVGGLALGLLEAFGSFYISSDFKDAIAFAVLLLILFVRPSGFLGRADVVKV